MIGTFSLPAQLRLDLPFQQDASGRFLPWIIALMVYLAGMGGIGLIWMNDTLAQWDASLASALTLQVPADASQPRLDMALGALRQTKGIVSARLLQPDETAKLLQPWLGNSVAVTTLPLPRLVDVRIDPRATIDYTALRQQQLDAIVPNTQLDNSRSWLGTVRDFALRVEGVITAGVVAVTVLIVTIIIFAARIGLAIHRSVIELLHLLGAQDAYIARQFQIHALSLGLRGGVIGGAAAALTITVVGSAGRVLELPVPIATHGILDWRIWLLLVIIALARGRDRDGHGAHHGAASARADAMRARRWLRASAWFAAGMATTLLIWAGGLVWFVYSSLSIAADTQNADRRHRRAYRRPGAAGGRSRPSGRGTGAEALRLRGQPACRPPGADADRGIRGRRHQPDRHRP